jgi:hypothetical protein
MRRWTTPLIVVGVAVVGLLAAADALRGNGEPRVTSPAPTITRPAPPTLSDALRREAITGFVVYSDDACVLHSLLLPRMLDEVVRTDSDRPFRMCRFSSGAGRYLPESELANPNGRLVAECKGGRIAVRELESGIRRYSVRGCPAAWRPDGQLTYAQGDRIMEEGRVLFTARELRAAASLHPTFKGFSGRIFAQATGLAWLDEDRLIVSAEASARYVEPQYLTVIFSGKALIGSASRFGRPAGDWFVSAAGNYAAAEDGTIVTPDGDFTDPPDNLPTGRAVAFSPDEQWLAYATGISIYLIATPRNSEPGRVLRLPIGAQDLAWEPAGATGTSTAAR